MTALKAMYSGSVVRASETSNQKTLPAFFNMTSYVILGDPRRPYPQDIEMRSGVLGRLPSLGSKSGGGVIGPQEKKATLDANASRIMPGSLSMLLLGYVARAICG